MDRQYDIIVIGAGNGGLSAAASACSRGFKTLLIEQHNLPGGFATSFRMCFIREAAKKNCRESDGLSPHPSFESASMIVMSKTTHSFHE